MKVVLLLVRGLHADFVGAYGNDWVATPHLDSLAADGIAFDRHYTDLIGPSSSSWRTGTLASAADTASGIGNVLAAHGVSVHWLGQWSAVASDQTEGQDPLRRLNTLLRAKGDAFIAIASDLPWGEEASKLSEPSEDFPAAPEGTETEEDPQLSLEDQAILHARFRYAAAVEQLDDWIGSVTARLRAPERRDDFILIVTSDQGASLGEHGTDIRFPHEELCHVPLLIRLPGNQEAGRRVPFLTQPIDLFPTVLGFFGLQAASQGIDFLSLFSAGSDARPRPLACTAMQGPQGEHVWSLHTPDWTLITPGAATDDSATPSQLYVYPDDRWEMNDVRNLHPDLCAHLENELRRFISSTQSPSS
jgi:arylsulfatase A-like enzyme